MMRSVSILLGAFVLCVATVRAAGPEAPERTGTEELRFSNGGEFTVMQLTDLHYTGADHLSGHVPEMLVRLIRQEKPDLVVITGDAIYRRPGAARMAEICGVIGGTGVPYAVTLGNHDAEQGLAQDELHALLRTLPGCVNGRYGGSGVRDFIIPVRSADGTREEARLYVMDSNDYNADDHSYKGFESGQVAWYRERCAEATARNGRRATGLAFFHVPLPEYAEAFRTAPLAGHRLENECPPRDNAGMFRALAEGGEVIGVFVGHDHSNDYVAERDGIALAYGRYSGGYGEYQDLVSGVRMIRLREGERGFETWVRLANGRERHRIVFPKRQ